MIGSPIQEEIRLAIKRVAPTATIIVSHIPTTDQKRVEDVVVEIKVFNYIGQETINLEINNPPDLSINVGDVLDLKDRFGTG